MSLSLIFRGGSVAAFLLISGLADAAKPTCVTTRCHGAVMKLAHLHGPLAVGDCTACHEAHAPGARSKPVASGAALCFRCHDAKDFQQKVRHAALDRGCSHCHTAHGGSNRFFVRSDAESLCRSCHSNAAAHAGKSGGDGKPACVACHEPHASTHRGLLKQQTAQKSCPRKAQRSAAR